MSEKMKAVVYTRYGSPDVLQLREVEKPAFGDNEVLVKIHAASLNAYDLHALKADPFFSRLFFGMFKPKNQILGVDVAGRVEAVGDKVKHFQPGDEVFGDICECGCGGFAEYVCVEEDFLVLKPAGMSFGEAAALPMAAVTALHGLRDEGRIQSGQKVLINGASGGVGTYAVQIAKSFGAEVTGVCSTGKLDMVRSIGADHAIDYTRENFARSGKLYDLILAANGNNSIWDYKRALNPGGVYVMSGGSMAQIFQAALLGPLISAACKKKMGTFVSRPDRNDLAFVKELVESGKVSPVIEKCYSLSAVPDAIRYLEEGHARGKLVITVVNDE